MPFIDLLINSVIALILFGIGLSLKINDFKKLLSQKRIVVIALFLQIIFLPILAFTIANFSSLSPEWQIGLFILAISPGGAMSNFISYLVKADVALSITLTTLNSLIIILTIPLLTNWALSYYLESITSVSIPLISTFLHLVMVLIFPVILGIFFNHLSNNLAKKIQNPLKYINSLLLALVFGIKFFASEGNGGSGVVFEDLFDILPAVVLFHLAALIIAYFVAKKMKINNHQATTIAIETGLQNTTLALLITGTFIVNEEMSKPILVYAIFTFFSTLIFGFMAKREFKYFKLIFKYATDKGT